MKSSVHQHEDVELYWHFFTSVAGGISVFLKAVEALAEERFALLSKRQ